MLPITLCTWYSEIALDEDRSTEFEDLIQFLLRHDERTISRSTEHCYLPLHCACFSTLNTVELVYNAHPQAVFHADCNRDSLEYVEAVRRLLDANPDSVTALFL